MLLLVRTITIHVYRCQGVDQTPGADTSSPVGYFPLAIGLLNVLFMVCATKVNAVFLSLFAGAGLGFFLLTAALWALAAGDPARGATLLVVSRPREDFLYRRAVPGMLIWVYTGNWRIMVCNCGDRLVSVKSSNA